MKQLLPLILACIITLFFTGCRGGQIPEPEPVGTVTVDGTTVRVTTIRSGTVETLITDAGVDMEPIETLEVSGLIDQRDFAFANGSQVKAVDFSGSKVTAYEDHPADGIPAKAFRENQNLLSFLYPEGITTIGAEAFYGANFMSIGVTGDIIIPEGVVEIGNDAFIHNKSSGKLVLPSTLKTIGSAAFWGSHFTGRLVLPTGITTIGSSAFYFCQKLTGPLELPATLTSIGEGAFRVTGINGHITLPENLEIAAVGIFNSSKITSVTLNDKLRVIGDAAFYNTKLAGNVIIPPGVESIGYAAFYDTEISALYVKWPEPIEYQSDMLRPEATVCVPEGAKAAYEAAEGWKKHTITEYTELP